MKSLAVVGAAIAALGLTSMPPAAVADTAVSSVRPRAEPVVLDWAFILRDSRRVWFAAPVPPDIIS